MNLKIGRMQGGCHFILHREQGADERYVTDTQTGEIIKAVSVGQTEI